MNEWIHNLRKKVVDCVGATRFKMNEMRGIITKPSCGHNFQFTEFSVIDFFRTNRRNLLGYRAKIGGKCHCQSQAKLGFSIILVFFRFWENFYVIFCKRYELFSVVSSHYPRKFR